MSSDPLSMGYGSLNNMTCLERGEADAEQFAKPFEHTIEALKIIPEIESPMRKLEGMYQLFNTHMVSEID